MPALGSDRPEPTAVAAFHEERAQHGLRYQKTDPISPFITWEDTVWSLQDVMTCPLHALQ